MSLDKSQQETVTIDQASAGDLNETAPLKLDLTGKVLDERYVIGQELGHGGVGAVYFARDRKLHDKPVVIKILLEKSLQNTWVVQKFQQEREALARVDHPGVVGILDAGELPDGKPYLVMQFIDGATLRSLIKPEGMPVERAAVLIRQIGRALNAAHNKGIFHRDLKPENIMVQLLDGGEEQVKIIDFGIAKLKDSAVAPSTVTGVTAGTVSYMAPEQLSGRPVAAPADIYAFGLIAHEMLTGRKPFNPETGFDLLEMQRAGVRVQPSDLRPSLGDDACRAVLRALSFEPSDRFQSARELGDALAQALSSEPSKPIQVAAPTQISPTQLSATHAAPSQTDDVSSKTMAGRFDSVNTPVGSVYPALILEEDAPPSRTWLKVGAGLLIIAVIALGAGALVWKRDALFGRKGAVAPAAALPERGLAYSLTVQKMRDERPYEGTFQSSGQEIFENGWKFQVNLSSAQDGYLYLLNEGPAADGANTYNLLFPEPKTNGGSPRVAAAQKLQTDWMRFDTHQGTEKFWIVWSVAPVQELDQLFLSEAAYNEQHGEVRGADRKTVRDFLSKNSSPKPEVSKDSAKKQTNVKGRGDMLVSFIELEHH